MKSVGSGPPLGGGGSPVGSAGMFGTLTWPMTRWMLVVSLAWIWPFERDVPDQDGVGHLVEAEAVVDQPDVALFERDVLRGVGSVAAGVAEVRGHVDGVLADGGERLGHRGVVEDRQVGDVEDLLGPVRGVVRGPPP